MDLSFRFQKHTLRFRFEAGTSRGVLHEKDSWIIRIADAEGWRVGYGECSLLPGLSRETPEQVATELTRLGDEIKEQTWHDTEEALHHASELTAVPAVRFALETAFLDYLNDGQGRIFRNSFSRGEASLPINGLVWMGDKEIMKSRIDEKVAAGFDCIKIKIGAIGIEDELNLVKYIRERYSSQDLVIRVDANGAFDAKSAPAILDRLAGLDVHSIEQPIAAGQWEAMKHLCQSSPVPIALDEELIGIDAIEKKTQLLGAIGPQYIILKPGLIGGLAATREWIDIAEQQGTGWWMTSALESNIGLSAIAQLTAEYPVEIPQGLGTGSLFHNNFESPLTISEGRLQYRADKPWDYSLLGL